MLYHHLCSIRNLCRFLCQLSKLLNVYSNTLWLRNMDFHLSEGTVESSRSKVINLKLQVSLVSSVDEQLLQGALWYPGGHLCECGRGAMDPWCSGGLLGMHFLTFPVATLQTFTPLPIPFIILYARNNELEEDRPWGLGPNSNSELLFLTLLMLMSIYSMPDFKRWMGGTP